MDGEDILPVPEHPRVCGENSGGKLDHVFYLGNTPVYAGKRVAPLFDPTHRRNTPAYAGKTLHHQHVSEPKPSFSITSSDKPTLQQACRSSQPGVVHRRYFTTVSVME